MMLRNFYTYTNTTLRLALLLTSVAVVLGFTPTEAYANSTAKVRVPTINDFVLGNSSRIAYAQGEDIDFTLVATLPEDIEGFYAYEHLPYWMVVSYDEGLTYVSDSASVTFERAENGERIDMTNQLRITSDPNYQSLVAGTPNITCPVRVSNSRLVKPASGDKLYLSYTLRLNGAARIGYRQGNVVRAHIEYLRPTSVDERLNASLAARQDSGLLLHTASTSHYVAPLGAGASVAGDMRVVVAATGVSAEASEAEPAVRPLDDGREGELVSTPETLGRIYAHRIDVTALDGDTNRPLAGVRYALRTGTDGAWFVEDDVWSNDASQATVLTTDEAGHASFTVIGSGTYTLVDVESLDGYDPADATPITITPHVQANSYVLTAASDDAAESSVTAADAESGVVAVSVRHYVHRAPAAEAGGNSWLAHLTNRSGLRLPQTGDIAAPFATIAALSVLALLGGLALRRRERGGTNTHRMSTHGGWADATEGTDHGC